MHEIFTQSATEKKLARSFHSYSDIEKAAADLLTFGYESILINTENLPSVIFDQDYWTNGKESFWLSSHQSTQKNPAIFRGALANCLTQGYEIKDAIVIAKMYVNQGTLEHWPESEIDLPYLTTHRMHELPTSFADCGITPLGIYPVVDSFHWLKILLPLGVTTLQLRIKDKQGLTLENEIQASIKLARDYQARLFINDYWQLAIKLGAYGVHLGQEDLNSADMTLIRNAGLRLGMSTHCYYEVARAHALNPSYMACGPIFPTTSKIMLFAPQGVAQLKRWQRTLQYPLVAIGGINHHNLSDIIAANVSGIAMISAITESADPIATTQNFLAATRQHVISR